MSLLNPKRICQKNSNESGRSRYFFSDIIEIANKYDLEIIIKDKEKK